MFVIAILLAVLCSLASFAAMYTFNRRFSMAFEGLLIALKVTSDGGMRIGWNEVLADSQKHVAIACLQILIAVFGLTFLALVSWFPISVVLFTGGLCALVFIGRERFLWLGFLLVLRLRSKRLANDFAEVFQTWNNPSRVLNEMGFSTTKDNISDDYVAIECMQESFNQQFGPLIFKHETGLVIQLSFLFPSWYLAFDAGEVRSQNMVDFESFGPAKRNIYSVDVNPRLFVFKYKDKNKASGKNKGSGANGTSGR